MAQGGSAIRIRTIAAIAAGAAVLGGCTQDPAPIVTETPSVSATPSASPSVSVSPSPSPSAEGLSVEELLALMPPGADRADVQGAVVTAEFFIEQLGPMFVTGETEVWRALSSDECEYCLSQIGQIESFFEADRKAMGGTVTLDRGATQGQPADDGYTYVSVVGTVAEILEVKDGGVTESLSPAATFTWGIQLTRGDTHWEISGVEVEE